MPTWAKHLCTVCAAASSSGEHLRCFCGHLGIAETSGPSRRLHLAQLVLEVRQKMVGHVPAVQPHCRFSGRPAHCLHAGIGISCGSFASLCRGGANGTQSCLWLSARLCCLCRCRSSNKTYCFGTALDIPRSTRWTRYCDCFFALHPDLRRPPQPQLHTGSLDGLRDGTLLVLSSRRKSHLLASRPSACGSR